jgi:hypothetical protein
METNTNQLSKFFKRMDKLELQRKEFKGVKSIQVKRNSHLEGDFIVKVSNFEIIEMSNVAKKTPISKNWNVKLGGKVHQMLQLASMELEASKIQVDHVVKEKQCLLNQCCTIWMLLELVQASLLEEIKKTKVLEVEEQLLKSTSNSNLVIPKGDFMSKLDSINHAKLGKEVLLSLKARSQEELKSELDVLLSQRMQEQFFKKNCIKHEVQFKKVGAKLDVKEVELEEME